MNKVFWTLLRARMQALRKGMFQIGKGKKKSALTTVGIGILFLYVAAVFFAMFYFLFDSLCEVYHMLGIDWLYFAMMAMLMLGAMFIVCIFQTQAEIFGAKDNEFLLSMPIKPSIILASRQAVLYLVHLVLGIILALPAQVVYIRTVGFSIQSFLGWLVLVLVLPFFSMTLSTIVAWVVHGLTARMRNKSLLTVIAVVVFLALYFLGYSKLQEFMMMLLTKGEVIAGVIRDNVLPFYWIGNAAAKGALLPLLLSVLMCVIPFGISYLVLSHFLYQLLTTKQTAAKVVYKKKAMKAGSVTRGLFLKEWRYLLSQPMYILNGCMGSVMLAIAIVAAIWKQKDLMMLMESLPGAGSYVPALLILVIGAISTMNILTASVISLEGKRFSILKAFPIQAREILLAKLSVHLVVTLPVVILGLGCFLILFQPQVIDCLAIVLGSLALAYFGAIFGLWMNLLMPDFNWNSEVHVVKQSASVFFAMFVPMMIEMAMVLLYIFLVRKVMDIQVYVWICVGILLTADGILHGLMMTKGCKIFENL